MIKPEVNQYWLGREELWVVISVEAGGVLVQRRNMLTGGNYGPRTIVEWAKFVVDKDLVDSQGRPIEPDPKDPNRYRPKEPLPEKGLTEGDVVLLKSGGFKMTVELVITESDKESASVHCVWHDADGRFRDEWVPPRCLMKCDQEGTP